ncbi:DUF6346 domain-containing protein [Actinoplanes sp. G11-F43]|uniref:DUF6346 domain-containing protein n=1 Tax=Actinoplanes sp. G11-F43 TaxID=3424130 RepID=UPI003D32DC71
MSANLESSVVSERDDRASLRSVLVLTLVGWLLFNAGATIGRYSGPDYAGSPVKGVGTVEKCERRGPFTILDGVGFYDACYLWVEWDRNGSERVLVDDPGFFRGEKPGDTIRIGYGVSRPEVGYSSGLELLKFGFVGLGGLLLGLGTLLLLVRLKLYVLR